MMKSMLRRLGLHQQSEGFILPILLITGVMLVLMIIAISSEAVSNQSASSHGYYASEAQLAADAGLDEAMHEMNTVQRWTGTNGDVTLLSDSVRNLKTTYSVVVDNGTDSSHKTLIVTAKAFSPISAVLPKVTREYAMDIEAVTSGTSPTSVSTGVGGLVLSSNAKISGGDVVIDGAINMSNNAQIGLSTNPVNVRVADEVCPTSHDSDYPRVCSASQGDTLTNPITMGNNSKIYADVIATNQTNGNNMSMDGLKAGQTFSPVALPTFDRASFENTINSSGQTMTGTQASTCSGGSVTWPANVKITGNVNPGNNCTIELNGSAWITGNFTPGNNGKIAVQAGVGTSMPDLVVDGSGGITLSNNSTVVPNSSNTGVEMLTFWSAASCSPECSSVTGSDLYTSQNTTTINLSNNGAAPDSVLYAYWSRVSISNNGQIGAVAGQTVQLSNNAVITFTASVPGSGNLITTWVKRGYMRQYN